MKLTLTLTVERVLDLVGDVFWEARIAEYPDVRGFEGHPYDAAEVAVYDAICLWLDRRSSDKTAKPKGDDDESKTK